MDVGPDGALVLCDSPYRPHTSLLYGQLSDADRTKAAEAATRATAGGGLDWDASDLVLMMTTGTEHQCWVEVARQPLGLKIAPGEVPLLL